MPPSQPFPEVSTNKQPLSPRHVIFAGVLFGIGCIIFSIVLAIQTPWLGISLQASEKGLKVAKVNASSPAADKLAPDDTITSL